MAKYTITSSKAGMGCDYRTAHAQTMREARSIAYRMALEVRSSSYTARPVWCEASAWHAEDGPVPVGGYDASEDGSNCAVVYREEP